MQQTAEASRQGCHPGKGDSLTGPVVTPAESHAMLVKSSALKQVSTLTIKYCSGAWGLGGGGGWIEGKGVGG